MSHKTCPYKQVGDEAYWNRTVAGVDSSEIDPFMPNDAFEIKPSKIITTAGSCFAQHIARYMKKSGYNYVVTEKAPAFLPEELHSTYNYGTYSARYCNIYTTRQLVQLFDRAYGEFKPVEKAWQNGKYWQDPFRPFVQPNGFISEEELLWDQEKHFAAVREIFETSHVFVFTLGLTEAWIDKRDGAVYPSAPGCGAGIFDSNLYEFHNLSVREVRDDLDLFIKKLFSVNNRVRVILTVSPVPLVATMSGKQVLSATTYSKSVLRVAAEEVANARNRVTYFPSYEIITSAASRGAYYMPDLRSVTEEGVSHVMRTFFKHFTDSVPDMLNEASDEEKPKRQEKEAADVICEEEISLAN